MNTDWMALFLAWLIGFAGGWALCSTWAAHWMQRRVRQMQDQHAELDKIREDQARFFRQAKEVEELFNHTRM